MNEKERLKISNVSNQDIPEKQTSSQDCSDIIYISIFFDGTGNNRLADGDQSSNPTSLDPSKKKWSNPARMFTLSQLYKLKNPTLHINNIYISGVGTKFNGSSSIYEAVEIKIEDSIKGAAFGGGGTRRLSSGEQRINNALKANLIKIAKSKKIEIESYSIKAKSKTFAEINSDLSNLNLIKKIRVSIFGFSRGAALARAFSNEWIWKCTNKNGKLLYEGTPIEFDVLGLFDTVASFGFAATNSANYTSFTGRDLQIDDRVLKCIHYVAGNELRFSFPVDLIRVNGKLKQSKWIEKVFPGMHSDVGGGYSENDQNISNNLARIPLKEMLNESAVGGTKIFTYDQLLRMKEYEAVFNLKVKINDKTQKLYDAYKAVAKSDGTIEEQIRSSMEIYYSAYGTLYRKNIKTVNQKVRESGNFYKKYIGPSDMATEISHFKLATHGLKAVKNDITATSIIFILSTYQWAINLQKWQYDSWNKDVNESIQNFYLNFIHDSKVDFISNIEPFSYFSSRGIYESNHSLYGWIEQSINRPLETKINEVKQTTNQVIEKANKKTNEVIDQTIKNTNEFKKSVKNTLNNAQKTISNKYNNTMKSKNEILKSAKNKYNEYSKDLDEGIKSTKKMLEGLF